MDLPSTSPLHALFTALWLLSPADAAAATTTDSITASFKPNTLVPSPLSHSYWAQTPLATLISRADTLALAAPLLAPCTSSSTAFLPAAAAAPPTPQRPRPQTAPSRCHPASQPLLPAKWSGHVLSEKQEWEPVVYVWMPEQNLLGIMHVDGLGTTLGTTAKTKKLPDQIEKPPQPSSSSETARVLQFQRSMSFPKSPTKYTLLGDSPMHRLVAEYPWHETILGPMSTWSESMLAAISQVLNAEFPMVLFWGESAFIFYNCGYIPFLGDKHPKALGHPGEEAWLEIWDVIKPMLERVYQGIVELNDDRLLLVYRHGYMEETYFTWSYSPVCNGDGSVGGVVTPVIESTAGILYKRRLRTLHALSYQMGKSSSVDVALELAATIFEKECADIPVSGLYIMDAKSRKLILKSTSGVSVPHPSMPVEIPLEHPTTNAIWPISSVIMSHTTQHMAVEAIWDDASGGSWPELHPDHACVFSIRQSPTDQVLGVMIMGLNPRKRLDGPYKEFVDQLRTQLANGILQARAIETETRRAQELAMLDMAKTSWFANVSHELRTPLTLILGPLTDLLASSSMEPKVRQQLQVMNRATLRLLKLVNTVLDFAGLESGRTVAQYVKTDLAHLTQDAASMFRAAIETGGLKFIVDVPDEPLHAWVDPDMWDKIVCNLISNAYKFTLKGEIVITMSRDPGGRVIRLSVKDTGCGISPEALEKLFQRFYRVQSSIGRSHEGSGIGLALVMELVQLHKGRCWVESQVGIGTTMFVEILEGIDHLPKNSIRAPGDAPKAVASCAKQDVRRGGFLAEAMKWTNASDASDGSEADVTEALGCSDANNDTEDEPLEIFGRKSFRILLADDNRDMRDYVSRLLQRHYRVTVVADGEEALADVMMPKMDGMQLMAAVRQNPRLKYIPFILLSARAGEDARVQGLELGADDYLVKPFSRKELMARVHTHLELGLLRTNLEQALQARESEFQLLCQMAPVGISRSDAMGHVAFVNDTWRDIMGMEHEELVYPVQWRHKVHPDDLKHIDACIGENNGQVKCRFSCEYRIIVPKRSPPVRHIIAHCAPLTAGAKATTWFSALVDVTDMRSMEHERVQMLERTTIEERARADEADENRKHQESFIDMICHEIRNPLNGIINNADLLRGAADRRKDVYPGLKEHVQSLGLDASLLDLLLAQDMEAITAIDMCARHQQVITDDVLNLSKLRSKRITLNPTWCRPQDVLIRVVRMFRAESVKKGIELVARFERDGVPVPAEDMGAQAAAPMENSSSSASSGCHTDDPPDAHAAAAWHGDVVFVDPDRLSQVVFNLLSNAIKFTDRAPTPKKQIVVVLQLHDFDYAQAAAPVQPQHRAETASAPAAAPPLPAREVRGHEQQQQQPHGPAPATPLPPTASAVRAVSLSSPVAQHTPPSGSSSTTTNGNSNGLPTALSAPSPSGPPSSSSNTPNGNLTGLPTANLNAQLVVTVSDTGIGMTPDEQAALFQRWSQANGKTYKEYGGSGLGLFICKELVEYMNGTISVTSTRGHGSVFRAQVACERRRGGLPTPTINGAVAAIVPTLAPPPSPPPSLSLSPSSSPAMIRVGTSKEYPLSAAPHSTALSPSSLGPAVDGDRPVTVQPQAREVVVVPANVKLLVVEDNIVNQRVLQRQLEIAGFGHVVANNGLEAVHISAAQTFDLIIMDVEMPVMDGLQATRLIRQREAAVLPDDDEDEDDDLAPRDDHPPASSGNATQAGGRGNRPSAGNATVSSSTNHSPPAIPWPDAAREVLVPAPPAVPRWENPSAARAELPSLDSRPSCSPSSPASPSSSSSATPMHPPPQQQQQHQPPMPETNPPPPPHPKPRPQQAGIPILGLSGNARDACRDRALAAGMTVYMRKPYDRKDLFATILRLVAEYRLQRHDTTW
ncbi:hypothetical protein DFJ77DRAFT_542014 [Powellomyces hirtus]|nr:hypothetical protein DFJ77DRAFT_542014 [Powellomyces hirtus]